MYTILVFPDACIGLFETIDAAHSYINLIYPPHQQKTKIIPWHPQGATNLQGLLGHEYGNPERTQLDELSS